MINHPEQHAILVSGATGKQGGAVARHLVGLGFRVRALTRNPVQPAARALADHDIEIVQGDLNDRGSLDRALAGAYGAFSVQNFYETGFEGEINQGKTFADAAKDAGVTHFVYSSVGSAERQTGIPHFESKWQIEEYARAIGLPATVLRPVFFMENWGGMKDTILGGQLPQPLSPDTQLQQIAVDDVGAFVALAFSDPDRWIGRSLEIAGDELSMTKTAETLSRVLNREVKYVQVPWDAFEQQVGKELAAMYRWFEDYGYKADIGALRKEYPPLKRLEEFLLERPF
jgi:uncharacterized protein YbjT (DUF2867 family)